MRGKTIRKPVPQSVAARWAEFRNALDNAAAGFMAGGKALPVPDYYCHLIKGGDEAITKALEHEPDGSTAFYRWDGGRGVYIEINHPV